jgi:peptidoglycan L-alanyl-D-glutamate endopeptidase CwlK
MLLLTGGGLLTLFLLSRTKKGQQLTEQATTQAEAAIQRVGASVFDKTEAVIATLDPRIRGLARQFVDRARAAGLPVTITSGRRTMAEQAKLYAQGRTAPGAIVTQAPPGTSPHNYGLAFDFARLNAVGKPSWPDDNDPFWLKAGAIGKALGMDWGGDWKNFKDRPHLELPVWRSVQADWKAGKVQIA